MAVAAVVDVCKQSCWRIDLPTSQLRLQRSNADCMPFVVMVLFVQIQFVALLHCLHLLIQEALLQVEEKEVPLHNCDQGCPHHRCCCFHHHCHHHCHRPPKLHLQAKCCRLHHLLLPLEPQQVLQLVDLVLVVVGQWWIRGWWWLSVVQTTTTHSSMMGVHHGTHVIVDVPSASTIHPEALASRLVVQCLHHKNIKFVLNLIHKVFSMS